MKGNNSQVNSFLKIERRDAFEPEDLKPDYFYPTGHRDSVMNSENNAFRHLPSLTWRLEKQQFVMESFNSDDLDKTWKSANSVSGYKRPTRSNIDSNRRGKRQQGWCIDYGKRSHEHPKLRLRRGSRSMLHLLKK